jgi:ribosomal protein S12 methylthiotransferase
LKLMKRPANEAKVLDRIHKWREIAPDITIRSSFVVGFPGETEEDFQYLLDWLDEAQLDRVGAFRFEPVEGAAANACPIAVPEEVKEERYPGSWRRPRRSAPPSSRPRSAARSK